MIDTLVHTNPFPGLRPFLEEENYLFFGREAQVDTLISKLSKQRFLAVVGTSGSGKSSLVNCGLFPALYGGYLAQAGSRWRIAQIRPGNDPMRELAAALAKKDVLFPQVMVGNLPLASVILTNLRRSTLGLIETCRQARLSADDNLLIVVDQFEEIFRFSALRNDDHDRPNEQVDSAVALVSLLLAAIDQSEIPIYVVITMRSDFLGDCSAFRGLPEAINEGQYLIPRMKREERKAAILGPVEVMGTSMTERLLMRLVNDVGDNPDQLSILQHALNRTWAEWGKTGNGPLDLEHYQRIGTMTAALDQHAERAYHELPTDRAKKLCEQLFKALTDRGADSRGVRRPTKLSTLCKITGATPEEMSEVIEVFRKPSRSFLMPPVGRPLDEETIIDISHESFMRIWKRLITWTQEEQESLRTYQRLSDAALLYQEGKSSLLGDPYLPFALNWKRTQKPNAAWASRYDDHFEEAMCYLDESKAHWREVEEEKKAKRRAEQKAVEEKQKSKIMRTRRTAVWVGVAALVAVAFMIYAFDQEQEAINLKEEAVLLQQRVDEQNDQLVMQKAKLDSTLVAVKNENRLLSKWYNQVAGEGSQEANQQAVSALTEGRAKEKARTSDAALLQTYAPIIREYRGGLKADTLIDVTEKISILESFDELMAMNRSATVTVTEQLKQWKHFVSYPRNTAQVDIAKGKIDSLERMVRNYASIREKDNFLTARKVIPPLPIDTARTFRPGNVYAWARVSAPQSAMLKVVWYSNGKPTYTDSIRVEQNVSPGYRIWNVQRFTKAALRSKHEVRLYNEPGYLIGRQEFRIVP